MKFKTFDEYINHNFPGYSAHTLYQQLMSWLPKNMSATIQNNIYYHIYNVWCDVDADCEDFEIFLNMKDFFISMTYDVNPVKLREEIRNAMYEVEYCNRYGYPNKLNKTWLKNNAYDWYSMRIISMSKFREIVAL